MVSASYTGIYDSHSDPKSKYMRGLEILILVTLEGDTYLPLSANILDSAWTNCLGDFDVIVKGDQRCYLKSQKIKWSGQFSTRCSSQYAGNSPIIVTDLPRHH